MHNKYVALICFASIWLIIYILYHSDIIYQNYVNSSVLMSSKYVNQTTKKLSYANYIKENKDLPVHRNARIIEYLKSNVSRQFVPDEYVRWTVKYEDYHPILYTAKSVLKNLQSHKKPMWADYCLNDTKHPFDKYKWNSDDKLDGKLINRKSYECLYDFEIVDGHKVPINPKGRTGLKGRGLLGRWGPNHAGDPIITRWKPESNKTILQVVAIQRSDTKNWALPGGMVDPGENVNKTLKREFAEEALDFLNVDNDTKLLINKNIDKLFKNPGVLIYQGYVDDPRNTDNCWMETDVYNFHDEDGNLVSNFNLKFGDDAINVKWINVNRKIILFSAHKRFVIMAAKRLGANLD